ncbi:MAG TPA: HAMP domain-containing sensor histidine kinase [Acidimicrobiia bacterium]|nr:HAMP domain-containing sensor histidine kinase [Acidimicrobiia bacterium]
MENGPLGRQMYPDTSIRSLTAARLLATTIAVVGVAISVVMYIRNENSGEQRAREALASTGEELTRVVADLRTAASEQTEALEGLFESSTVVTQEEFDHFAVVIGGAPTSSLVFASPVPTGDPDVFSWPVVYEARSTANGYEEGFDLVRDPALRDAIDRALRGEDSASSGFIALPGDEHPGDVALVSAMTRPNGEMVGVGVAIIQIDEALAERARLLLEDQAEWRIGEVEPGEESIAVSTADRWSEAVTIGDRDFVIELDSLQTGERAFGEASDWLALLGVVTSSLIAVLTYNLMKRRATIRQIEKLEQTLAEKDQFLATVSHELRTPLTAVVGMLEVIHANLDHLTPDEYALLLGDARDGALELERLIEDYLTTARLSAGALTIKTETVDLDTMFTKTVARLNLPGNLTVEVGPLGSCAGDSLRIRQIARNILRNAARYARNRIEIRNTGDDAFVVVEIRNDGDPVPDDLLDGLFEPFSGSNGPGETESIGLGLSVSRGLARRMGGDLLYSVDGDWVVFSILLPAPPRTNDLTDLSRESVEVL